MKLHRIHVENFKAIDERTLELPDCGVVIATGRNEIGKTSMVEALDLLLDTSNQSLIEVSQSPNRSALWHISAGGHRS